MIRTTLAAMLVWYGAACHKAPSHCEVEELLERFRRGHREDEWRTLCEAARRSADGCLSAYAHLLSVVFPSTGEERGRSAQWLLRNRDQAKHAIIDLASVRAESQQLIQYLDRAAFFMDEWADQDWRVSVLRNAEMVQRPVVDSAKSRIASGELEASSDYGSLAVFKELRVACALFDLAERYNLLERLGEDARQTLDYANLISPHERVRFVSSSLR